MGSSTMRRGAEADPVIAITEVAPEVRAAVLAALDLAGRRAIIVEGTQQAREPSVIFCEIARGGVELVTRLARQHPAARVVAIGAAFDPRTVVLAVRGGAFDFLLSPLDALRVREVLLAALSEIAPRPALAGSLVGDSPAMQALANQIRRVQQNDVVVSLCGETGTGKELVARAIHDGGPRKSGPFVAINCAAIPQQLHESELFGHERGSFTGAVRQHRGCFEQANGGTLFLDEIAEMSLSTQAMLLRALEERRIRRVGGTADVAVDIRVICASHRNLAEEVKAGRFRNDLYFRLVVYPIQIAPLRDRPGDVLTLAHHFLEKFGGRTVRGRTLNDDVLQALTRYAWPGNVRELENIARRILIASDGGELIGLEHLPPELQALVERREERTPEESAAPAAAPRASPGEALPFSQMKEYAIERALETTGGKVDQAAKLLGMSRATLYRRLARLQGRDQRVVQR